MHSTIRSTRRLLVCWTAAVVSAAASTGAVANAGTVPPSDPPTETGSTIGTAAGIVPVDDLLAAIDRAVADNPDVTTDETAELAACPFIDVERLNAVLADAGTDWQVSGALRARLGHDELDEDDFVPDSVPERADDLWLTGFDCGGALSEDAELTVAVLAAPPGVDLSVDDEAEQTFTSASSETLGGRLMLSCELDADDDDDDQDSAGNEGEPGGECAATWRQGDLVIAVHVDDEAEPVDPDALRAVLLGLVPAVAGSELAVGHTGDTASPDDAASSTGPDGSSGADGVAIPGGVQPEILLEGTWFDDEGRLYMPESSAQSDEKDAAFCDFLFGTPDEIAAMFGVESLTLIDGSGIFNNGGGGTGWRCGYTTDTDAGPDDEEPGVIFILSSKPFEIDEDPDGIAEYFVLDGGDTEESALLAISDDFPGEIIDADLADTWLTTASSRTAR